MPETKTTVKDVVQTVQSVVATVAVIVAGYWGYTKFDLGREAYPRAHIEHQASHTRLTVDGDNWVRLEVEVKNVGNTKLNLESGFVEVRQVLPLACVDEADPHCPANRIRDRATIAERDLLVDPNNTLAAWPQIARKDLAWAPGAVFLEPGESESFHFDFLLPAAVAMVTFVSYFPNVTLPGKDSGWSRQTTYNFRCAGGALNCGAP